jgi:hypothetical protein
MDALMANYASDPDSDGGEPAAVPVSVPELPVASALLPPPPLDLLQPPNFVGMIPCSSYSLNLSREHPFLFECDGISGHYLLQITRRCRRGVASGAFPM